MRVLIPLLVLVLALAGIVWWITDRDVAEPASVPPVTAAEEIAEESSLPLPTERAAEPTPEGTSEREEVAATPLEEETTAPADDEDQLAEIRGHFLLPGGAPAIGAEVGVHGWGANSDRVREHGRPTDYEDPSTTTDHEGRFSIRFDPPQAYQFTLDAKIAGHSDESWRWGSIETGSVVDVGTVTFARAGTIVGTIVDTSGKTVRGAWRIYANAVQQSGMEGKDQTRVSAQLDPSTGRFRLEGLPPGPARLKAYLRIANWIDGPVVEVVTGEEVEGTLVLDQAMIDGRG